MGSGHRVKGRETIACDAEGALDAMRSVYVGDGIAKIVDLGRHT